MKEFISKHKVLIAVVLIALIAACILIPRLRRAGSAPGETAYVETVENLTGANASLGLINRFAGVVEPQGTWSVNRNNDVEIKEIFVKEGDKVEEGDSLFEYDTLKYEEDLQQAEIDLERLENDYEATQEAIAELEKEKRKASSSEQANYTIQIKEQNLTLKDKELDIEMKKAEIEKLGENIDNAVVKSGISGVIKKINEGESGSMGDDDNSFITVMKVGNYRIKGTVNEQNIGELTVGASVLAHSRVNDRMWKGTITKIDTENTVSNDNNGYYISGSDGSRSSKYPFYVELDSSDGLILGQHVYIEPDLGQADEDATPGIWLASYMVDTSDPEHPFVWKDAGGRIKKQEVVISETMEEIGRVKISQGLDLTDSICIPDGTIKEGMKTAPMSEKPEDSDMGDMGDMGEGDGTDSAVPEAIEVGGESEEGAGAQDSGSGEGAGSQGSGSNSGAVSGSFGAEEVIVN